MLFFVIINSKKQTEWLSIDLIWRGPKFLILGGKIEKKKLNFIIIIILQEDLI